MGSMARCAGLCVLLAASLAAATSLPAAASQLPNPATLLAAQTPQPELPAGQICYKIEIEADGLYTVSYEALLAAGLNVTHTPPLSLALSWRGQPVAVEDVGDGDQVFEPGEGLRFFGLKFHASVQDEKYTDTDVYWLGVSEAGGARIQSRPADLPGDLPPLGWFTDTLRAEASRAWWSRWTNKPQSSDTWFWDYVNTTQTVTRVYTTSVPFPASGDYAIIVRANAVARESSLYGFRQHHLRFSFNDALVADTSWYGGSQGPERTVSRSLDTAYLLSGTNSLTMTVLTDTTSREQLFFNWFELTYRRAFTAAGGELRFSLISSGVVTVAGLSLPDARAYDTSIPTQPVRIALPTSGPVSFEAGPGSYWLSSPEAERAPARLSRYSVPELDPPGGADYVIVTHASLLAQAERLAAFHTDHGLKVIVVDATDLYNQYNGGVYHPEAIRRYLWHAYDTWPRRPAYALLMGDGHFNFKNYPCVSCSVSDIQGEPILIPPYLAFVDPWQGEIPADNLFVTVSGNDPLPDMMIGRLPATNAAQAEAMVDKLLAQPGPQFEPGSWRAHFVCVADNPDDGGNFWADCDAGLALAPSDYAKSKVYHQQAPYTSTSATRAAIIQAIDAGAGNLVYHGHGSLNQWGGTSDPLFKVAEASSLANTGRLPVIQTYGCLDGFFSYPNNPSMAETLLRMGGRGALGQWAPTGLGLSVQHAYLQEGFSRALFRDGASTFGQAALAGKLDLWAMWGTAASYIYHTHTLFGDPALSLVPHLELAQQATPGDWQPGQVVTYSLAFTNTDLWPLTGGVLTTAIPSALLSPSVAWSGVVLTPAGWSDVGSWQVSNLAYNSPAQLSLSFQVDPHLSQPDFSLTQTVYLAARTYSGIPVTANATTTRVVQVPSAVRLRSLAAGQPASPPVFGVAGARALIVAAASLALIRGMMEDNRKHGHRQKAFFSHTW